jgi:beta-glucosidase
MINKLTKKEKLSLLTGESRWTLNPIERVGIKRYVFADGPHGVRSYENPCDNDSLVNKATATPSLALLANTFNRNLVYKVGDVLGKEAAFYGVDALLAPGINLKRSPLAGRNFEYFSEDPVVTGVLAKAFVNGVQKNYVAATLKHYILNEQETNRFNNISVVDERTLHEVYLKPFKIALKAKPKLVMSSYNRALIINKTKEEHITESDYLVNKILRRKLGFKGTVVSDWDSVQNKDNTIGIIDIEMPCSKNKELSIKHAKKYDDKVIDKSVNRIIKLFKFSKKKKQENVNFLEHHELMNKVVEEGIVLLKNENMLPLLEDEKLIIIGPFFKNPPVGGGGSSELRPFLEDSLFNYMNKENYTYYESYEMTDVLKNDLLTSKKVLFLSGHTKSEVSESKDKKSYSLPENQINLLRKISLINKNIILITYTGSSYETKSINNTYKALIYHGFASQCNGKPLYNVLYGIINPSGKLSETFPVSEKNNVYPFPVIKDYNEYKEKTLFGYRYYNYKEIDVSYPFGYGLSYTTFSYDNLEIKCENGEVYIYVDITNTGVVKGKETVFVFLVSPFYQYKTPTLVAFDKKEICPSETQRYEFKLTKEDLEIYNPNQGYITPTGIYDIYVGSNANDFFLKETFNYICDKITNNYTRETTLFHLIQNKKCQEYYDEIVKMYELDAFFFEVNPVKRLKEELLKKGIAVRTANEIEKKLLRLGNDR